MLREAAYLGVPSISIFRGELGAVDRMLEEVGAIRVVTRADELDAVDWPDVQREARVPHHPIGRRADRRDTQARARVVSAGTSCRWMPVVAMAPSCAAG